MDTEIKFRVATEDKGRFEAAAERDGRKLSDWVRRACFAALPIERERRPNALLDEPRSDDPIPTYPPGKPIQEVFASEPSEFVAPSKDFKPILTRAEREAKIDPDRIDAFQRKMAQSQKGRKPK